MSSTVKGFNLRDLTQHAKAALGTVNVNIKALPLSAASQNLFTVTGAIQVNALIGVVTVATNTGIKPTIGVSTGTASSISAAPAAGFTGAAGNIISMPTSLGAALPALISASQVSAKVPYFALNTGIITVTTDVTITAGTIAWILAWSPLYPKNEVATVAND